MGKKGKKGKKGQKRSPPAYHVGFTQYASGRVFRNSKHAFKNRIHSKNQNQQKSIYVTERRFHKLRIYYSQNCNIARESQCKLRIKRLTCFIYYTGLFHIASCHRPIESNSRGASYTALNQRCNADKLANRCHRSICG